MNNVVDARDVSFVVQGTVCGTQERPNEYTKRLCKSIRKYFPNAEIIFSTWEDQNVREIDADKVVFNKMIDVHYIVRPDGKKYAHTLNQQIITSREGIACATRKYVVKVRSDLIFRSDSLLKFLDRYTKYAENKYRVVRQRLLVLPTYNYRRGMIWPYNICDWIYAGLKEDLEDLFNIPLQDYKALIVREDGLPWIEDNVGAEQYIWIEYLESKGIQVKIKNAIDSNQHEMNKFEKSIAQNLVLLPATKMGIDSQKGPKCGYVAKPWLSQGLYTFSDWKRLYCRYGGGKKIPILDLHERVAYAIMFGIREKLAKSNTNLYVNIVDLVRKYRGR